jgi:DNA-binding response OmpR family regulator
LTPRTSPDGPGRASHPVYSASVEGGQVLIVSPDERWLRVLEVTLHLGGHQTVSRRSVTEALRLRAGDDSPRALVLDLGVDSTAGEVDAVRELLGQSDLPAVVILPERLGSQRDAFAAAGAIVLVRPYRPSELYAALRPLPVPGAPSPQTAAEGSAPPAGPAPTASAGEPGPPPDQSGI